MGKKYKIYIYGAGKEYNRLSSYLSAYDYLFEIMGIMTTHKQPFHSVDGRRCVTVHEINDEVDYIIIAAEDWKSIAEVLWSRGVPEEKIIRSSVFYLPNFNFADYLKIREEKISILSNNCLAGIIYKELGLKVLSPTINMSCIGRDYITFLEHYKYYCSKEMRAYTEEDYERCRKGFHDFIPKGMIDNKITWIFNHYLDAETGIEAWKKGLERLNYQNIVALAALQSDEEAYDFEALPIKRKLGFYYKELHLEHVIHVKEFNDLQERYHFEGNWLAYVVQYGSSLNQCIPHVDWIKFLSGKEDFLRFQY